MIIRSIDITNFCQHRKLQMEFKPALNMLVGRNGAGKTNMLRAIQLLLTGDAGGYANKGDDITEGIPKNAPSSVVGFIGHSGHEYEIQRRLRPTGNSISGGGLRLEGFQAVNNAICDRIGTTRQQLDNYVFVRQRQVDGLIDRTPTERGEDLAALFGVASAKRIWKGIGDFLAGIKIPPPIGDRDTLISELAQAHARLNTAQQQVALIAVPANAEAYCEIRRQIVANYQTAERLQAEMTLVATNMAQTQAALNQCGVENNKIQADITLLEQTQEMIRRLYDEAKQQQAQWQAYEAMSRLRDKLQQDRHTLSGVIRGRANMLPMPSNYVENDVLEQQIKPLTAALQATMAAITQLENQATTCYACGQTLPAASNREAQRAMLYAERERLAAQRQPLVDLQDAAAAYRVYQHQATLQRADIKAQISNYRRQLAGLNAVEQPQQSKEEIQQVLTEYESYGREQAVLQRKLQGEQQRAATISGTYSSLESTYNRHASQLAAMPKITQEMAQNSTNEYHAMQAQQHRYLPAKAEVMAAEAALDNVTRKLQAFDAAAVLARRTQAAVSHMESIRHIFHPNEAPRVVSYTYLELMETEINEILRIFDAPFYVTPDDSLGFMATFHADGKTIPDRRLSVGERIVLSIAFRIVVNATFASTLGLLIMDEPAAGLDEHNIGCLPRALECLRTLSEERGLQVLFVSHEQQLRQYFDNVIEIVT